MPLPTVSLNKIWIHRIYNLCT